MKSALYEKYPELFDFLVEKTRQVTSPMSVSLLTKDYVRDTGSNELLDTLNHRIYGFRSKLSQLYNFDKVTRVKLLFALSGPLDVSFLKEIQKEAIVEVDYQRRITKYISNDNLVKLEGDHKHGSKVRIGYAERKRRSMRRKDSEDTDDESREDEEEEAILKIGETRTSSGRIVKKPRLYIDQLAASYSVLMTKPKQPTEDNGQFILYDDTGDSRTALLPEEQDDQRRKNFDMMKIIKEEENDVEEEESLPNRQNIPLILDSSKINHLKLSTLRTVPLLTPTSEPAISQSLTQNQVISPLIVPKFSDSRKFISQSSSSETTSSTVNINDFFKPLRNMVEILKSPSLLALQQRLDRKISEFDANDMKIPKNVILEAFESSLRLITKHSSSSISIESSTRFKEFLLIFQMTTNHLTSSEYVEFNKWLEIACQDSKNEDNRISFEKIRLGLEFGMEYVLP